MRTRRMLLKKLSPLNIMRFIAFGLLSLGLLSSPFYSDQLPASSNAKDAPAAGRTGMVSTAHPLATQAGLNILQSGGNAFDAAVAIAATLSVVEPMMSGLGGYGTILVFDAAKGQPRFLNASSRIPGAVNSDAFRPPTPDFEQNRRGAKAVSTPGNLHAWEALSKQYGTLPWRDLFQPAIRIADEGFSISKRMASLLRRIFSKFPPHAREFYGKNARPLAEGDKLIQRDLAKSFRDIAEKGTDVFYQGEIGLAIDKAMKEASGFLSLEDLKADRAEWWRPIQINYRGYTIMTASPPATAFPSLIRLGMMSRFETKALGHNTTAYLHLFAEVTKHAFWCRLAHAGDQDFSPPPLERLLSEGYWKEQVDRIDLTKAKPFEYPGLDASPSQHTTHFVVADKQGNIVCATQTLGGAFGSLIMPEGTGIWLNNSLSFCTFEPKGNPMDAHAGHHKLSGDCPTLVLKDGKPWVAVGTPGGHTIGQTVPQMIMNVIDFGMDVQKAINAPRISFVEPDLIIVEEQIPEDIRDELARMGHHIRAVEGLGNAHGLTIEYGAEGKPIRFTGGADQRGEGIARGF